MFYTTRTIREYEVRPAARSFFRHQLPLSLSAGYNTQWGWQNGYCCTPEANVLELDDRFLIEVSLPGVVLDDVNLKAEEQYITIHAKRLPTPFEEQAMVHIQEMPFTNLFRTFEFSMPILAEQVEARMDRGILYISVPKLEIAHRIPVSAGTIDARLGGLKTQVVSKSDVRAQQKEAIVK